MQSIYIYLIINYLDNNNVLHFVLVNAQFYSPKLNFDLNTLSIITKKPLY